MLGGKHRSCARQKVLPSQDGKSAWENLDVNVFRHLIDNRLMLVTLRLVHDELYVHVIPPPRFWIDQPKVMTAILAKNDGSTKY